ncbi:MAG: hypothetical protein KF890_04575 [Nitrospira sp.]|nr:hypothetical protein [Nitrospira sp.]
MSTVKIAAVEAATNHLEDQRPSCGFVASLSSARSEDTVGKEFLDELGWRALPAS